MLDELTAGWSEERRQAHVAQSRAENAKALAEVEAEYAGKSDEEIVAGWEEQSRTAAELEPEIPRPAAFGDGPELKSLSEMTAAEKAEVERWSSERKYALPKGVPPLPTPRTIRGCTELTGSDEPRPGRAVNFSPRAWCWGLDLRPTPRWMVALPWTDLSSIEIEGAESAESRVTVPRAALFGVFSLGLKKSRKRSYLILGSATGTCIFEVAGVTPIELRAHLTPVTDWFNQYRERIQALAAVRS
jgi:hypothetical protein